MGSCTSPTRARPPLEAGDGAPTGCCVLRASELSETVRFCGEPGSRVVFVLVASAWPLRKTMGKALSKELDKVSKNKATVYVEQRRCPRPPCVCAVRACVASVPAGGSACGGLFFPSDPLLARLDVRDKGIKVSQRCGDASPTLSGAALCRKSPARSWPSASCCSASTFPATSSKRSPRVEKRERRAPRALTCRRGGQPGRTAAPQFVCQ